MRRKILIVDEEQAVRDLFVRTLEPGGLDVVAVADPEEGMETAKRIEPDIIYLSLLFSESNGLKVGKALHSVERLKEIPIVILISYRGELDPKYTKTIGIVDVLVKPLRAEDILAMTAGLLGERISFDDKPGGAAVEEREEDEEGELPSPAEETVFSLSAGGEETMQEGTEAPSEATEEEIVEVADSSGESDIGKEQWARDLAREEEDSIGDGFVPDMGRVEDKEGDLPAEPGAQDSHQDGGAGEDMHDDTDPGEPPGGEKVPVRKYLLFVALTLLVAAAVFAALQIGIYRNGDEKLATDVVKETPANNGKPGGSVQAGKAEAGDRTGKVRPAAENTAGPTASQSRTAQNSAPSAARKVKHPPVRRESRELNEGLKEPKTVGGRQKRYSLQVGAFAQESNAVSLAKRLKKRGYDVFIEKAGNSGLHKVFVGRFDDYNKARSQSEVLLQKDGIKSVIYRH